jgi:hypothetical protein
MPKALVPKMSPEKVRELFNYDAETGEFSRRIDYGNGIAGQTFNCDRVMVDSQSYTIGRVIWCHYYGEWPPVDMHVDHKNRRHGLNYIENLRLATPRQNQQNKGGSGQYAKGVTWRARIEKPWQAKIRVEGIRIHLGSFGTEEEAAEAYRQACIKYHGEFACHD